MTGDLSGVFPFNVSEICKCEDSTIKLVTISKH